MEELSFLKTARNKSGPRRPGYIGYYVTPSGEAWYIAVWTGIFHFVVVIESIDKERLVSIKMKREGDTFIADRYPFKGSFISLVLRFEKGWLEGKILIEKQDKKIKGTRKRNR